GRRGGGAEEHQMRRLIGIARFLKNLPPPILVLAQHFAHEVPGRIGGLARLRRSVLDRRPIRLLMAGKDFAAADQQARIDAKRPARKGGHPQAPQAPPPRAAPPAASPQTPPPPPAPPPLL